MARISCEFGYSNEDMRIGCRKLDKSLCKFQRYCTVASEWQNTSKWQTCDRFGQKDDNMKDHNKKRHNSYSNFKKSEKNEVSSDTSSKRSNIQMPEIIEEAPIMEDQIIPEVSAKSEVAPMVKPKTKRLVHGKIILVTKEFSVLATDEVGNIPIPSQGAIGDILEYEWEE